MAIDLDHRHYKLGLTTSSFPAKIFKSWAIWQNEKDSVLAESQTSQQGETLKSCSHNINADMAPLLYNHYDFDGISSVDRSYYGQRIEFTPWAYLRIVQNASPNQVYSTLGNCRLVTVIGF